MQKTFAVTSVTQKDDPIAILKYKSQMLLGWIQRRIEFEMRTIARTR